MIIAPYDEKWTKDFCNIKSVLIKNLSKPVIIEHVGSTSIFGMYAKPIIDLVIAIDNSEFQIIKNDLFKIGYTHEGDLGIVGREAFKRENIIKYGPFKFEVRKVFGYKLLAASDSQVTSVVDY